MGPYHADAYPHTPDKRASGSDTSWGTRSHAASSNPMSNMRAISGDVGPYHAGPGTNCRRSPGGSVWGYALGEGQSCTDSVPETPLQRSRSVFPAFFASLARSRSRRQRHNNCYASFGLLPPRKVIASFRRHPGEGPIPYYVPSLPETQINIFVPARFSFFSRKTFSGSHRLKLMHTLVCMLRGGIT